MGYRIEYLGPNWPNVATFEADDDNDALKKAQTLYRARRDREGFRIWQGYRLVYTEPPVIRP
jgi:hypothetical protein